MKNHDGKSFTRLRSLVMGSILTIIIRCSPYALQIKIDDYYKEIGEKEKAVSKQAYSKARTNLAPEVVKGSFELTTKTMLECEDIEYYKGRYRLCAIDGSDNALDNAGVLLDHFGGSGSNNDCAMATVSLCYDPLNNIVLSGGIYPYGTCERIGARECIKAVSALPRPKGVKDLYIFDRYYPSKELFAEMIDSKICFLMRVRRKFNTEFDDVKKSGTVRFFVRGREYKVRVFKVTLDTGEEEILVSNLSGRDLKRKEVGDLYFKRWGIEIKFDSLKNKLELENWSGRRPVTVYQDFWAKLDIANTAAALEWASNEVIEGRTSGKDNKYEQTTNENRLISKFCDDYIKLLVNDDPQKRLALFDELVADIAKRPEQVKPDRKVQRKIPRKKKFCDRRKRALR